MKLSERRAILGWHFAPKTHLVMYARLDPWGIGGRNWKVLPVEQESQLPPSVCIRGLHASTRLADALTYGGDMPILRRVACWGQIDRGQNKLACTHRRVLWYVPANNFLREVLRRAVLRFKGLHPDTRRAVRQKRYSDFAPFAVPRVSDASERACMRHALNSLRLNKAVHIRRGVRRAVGVLGAETIEKIALDVAATERRRLIVRVNGREVE